MARQWTFDTLSTSTGPGPKEIGTPAQVAAEQIFQYTSAQARTFGCERDVALDGLLGHVAEVTGLPRHEVRRLPLTEIAEHLPGATGTSHGAIHPHGNDVAVMTALKKRHPQTMLQVEICEATGLSPNTVRDSLNKLRDAGYTHRPNGERKGETLTPAGLNSAQLLAS
jgi:hypothetical protein